MVADGSRKAVDGVADGGSAASRAAVDAVAVVVVGEGGAVGEDAGDALGVGKVVEVAG